MRPLKGAPRLRERDSPGCVAIHSGASPILRRNIIHDGASSGVFVYEHGNRLIEDNDIFGNGNVAMAIQDGSAPTLRRNRINKNAYEAIWIYEQGGGVYEKNDLRDNTRGAWDIADDSKALVTRRANIE